MLKSVTEMPKIAVTGPEQLPAARTLTLSEGPRVVARLTYFLSADPLATLQLLDVNVVEDERRKGHGSRIYNAALDDARKLLGQARLRRVFAGVAHKSHIPLRALLTHLGFHHVSTTTGLYKGEDLLVYIKAYT